ncbi:hypothetical protein Scep_030449 [Stephania cephalantha]|uniref:Uncharacterized protein n=1 Tax=Stephania cephalantha TaxID=152367 RepID=A0AAP0E7E7_9MAGN
MKGESTSSKLRVGLRVSTRHGKFYCEGNSEDEQLVGSGVTGSTTTTASGGRVGTGEEADQQRVAAAVRQGSLRDCAVEMRSSGGRRARAAAAGGGGQAVAGGGAGGAGEEQRWLATTASARSEWLSGEQR